MKNELLAEAIDIANGVTMKLPTRGHLIALYEASQRAEKLVYEYGREDKCTGITRTCPCLVCQSVRADERQDRMDNKGRATMTCPECGGDGIEVCNNPDHAGLDSGLYGRDNARLGCPVCGHDEQYKVKNSKCCRCNGTGIIESCTGITSTCPCEVCKSVRADDLQDRMDDYGPELAGDE